jgi:ubiquinone/menaquinone biosynthesis C-methylase UbiE
MSVTPCGDATRSVFDAAADAYDAARPSYPAALFDELEDRAGPLAGRLVLDWGAGTGIASRQLAARGARVVSLDIGEQMLRRALFRSPGSACVLADGNQMPVRSGAADLATFAQAWHWFANPAAIAEVARVLKPGGYWAAWWNRTDAAGEGWFDSYQNLLLARCPGYNLQRFSHWQMAPDWHATSATGDGIAELAEMAESAGAVVVPGRGRYRRPTGSPTIAASPGSSNSGRRPGKRCSIGSRTSSAPRFPTARCGCRTSARCCWPARQAEVRLPIPTSARPAAIAATRRRQRQPSASLQLARLT